MAAQSARRACIYCMCNVGSVRKGEHIIPCAVGGARTIKTVCGTCNNEFSRIDAELCSRSPLSIVASQQIEAHLWQCCADIVAPLRSKEWRIQTGSVLQPLRVHIEWKDFARMVPTIKMLHTETKLTVECVAAGT